MTPAYPVSCSGHDRYFAIHHTHVLSPLRSLTEKPCIDDHSGSALMFLLGSSALAREVEDSPGVVLGDLAGYAVGHVSQGFLERLPAMGPVAVRMRVIALEHDVVSAD